MNEADGPAFKIENDPRTTKVGRIIRRLSIDELPQLINCIKGDMSIVGPRPPWSVRLRSTMPISAKDCLLSRGSHVIGSPADAVIPRLTNGWIWI